MFFAFVLIKADRINQLLDFLGAEFEHCGGRVGDGKQTVGRFCRGRVLGPQAQNARDQHPKRAFVGLSHQGHDRRVPLGHLTAQDAERRMNLAVFHRASVLHRVW